ncbi:hypothetical protein [Rhizobium rhizoryzae]|uniref:Uncharacterized protein n=1 Tax=Rhizobium rhizoryzae TaxID=451876 RepID=A0A7W6LK40_9HYPH|nr:hypothetical protein [Rhizobium rhizoryzae]MBB4145854.1 hypothetical protein [Rhizobium rhizoryzae]
MIYFSQAPTPISTPVPGACRMQALTERLASDMRELAFNGRVVDVDTLSEFGWTKDTIMRLAPAATSIARRRSVRQISQ